MLLTGGGTGGHVYPALTVIRAFQAQERTANGGEEPAILWVGSSGGMEQALVQRAGLPFRGIAAGGLRGLAPWTMALNLARLALGTGQAWRIVGQFRPDVIFATGGFVCAPTVLAGRLRRVPSLLYLPDIEPGLAVRFLARLVDRVAVSFEASRRYLPGAKVVVTGYPVRAELLSRDRQEARRRLSLEPDGPALLVFGGSRGAHRINAAAREAAEGLARIAQVIHVTGPDDAPWLEQRREELPVALRERYRVYPYLHEEMVDALVAADLAVARAGAATLGEFPAVGLASILVPYPYSGQHQMPNARYLADAGAAIIVEDGALTGERLLAEVTRLLADEKGLAEMRRRAARLAEPRAATNILTELRRLGEGTRRTA